MNVDLINPFIRATVDTFGKMLDCPVERSEMTLKEGRCPLYPVSGVIGMSGKGMGTVVLSLSQEFTLTATSTMLMTDIDELDDDVVDAVGELVNMVAGNAKNDLATFGLSISLPSVVMGQNYSVSFPSRVTPIPVRFESPWGPLALEVGLETSE